MNSRLKGFTLIELLITMGLAAILFGMTTFNFFNLQYKTDLNASVLLLVSDLKQQQVNAMSGETQGVGQKQNFGIKLESIGYYLFQGDAFVNGAALNIPINLKDSVKISSTTFPNQSILFQKGTGEIVNFTEGQNTISLINEATNEIKIITLNKFGTVISVQ